MAVATISCTIAPPLAFRRHVHARLELPAVPLALPNRSSSRSPVAGAFGLLPPPLPPPRPRLSLREISSSPLREDHLLTSLALRHQPGSSRRAAAATVHMAQIAYTEDQEVLRETVKQQGLYEAAKADPGKKPFERLSSERWADGTLDIVRWEGDRMLRIWKPAEWKKGGKAEGYPVLYLNDGQNVFDDRLSFSGHSWRAAGAASKLIASGTVPPFVIVAIDHSGPLRSWDYTPYQPGSGPMGLRKDAAKWPGGGVNHYLDRLVNEILPWAADTYTLSSASSRMAFGGSSFGGICALACGLRYPQVFDALLVESPSLWLANEKFLLEDLANYKGPWPARTFLAMGTAEYTAARRHDPQPQFDELLTTYIGKVVNILALNGVSGDARVLSWVDAGAGHTESAWAKRLPAALEFLLSPWKDQK